LPGPDLWSRLDLTPAARLLTDETAFLLGAAVLSRAVAIDLSGCTLLGDLGVAALLLRASQARVVRLTDTRCTDDALEMLAAGGPLQLTSLDVSRSLVTDRGVAAIAAAAAGLKVGRRICFCLFDLVFFCLCWPIFLIRVPPRFYALRKNKYTQDLHNKKKKKKNCHSNSPWRGVSV
jgi:hypothetical protein